MNILYAEGDNPIEWNCSEWRCRIPTKAINDHTEEHNAVEMYIGEWDQQGTAAAATSKWADIIVVQRIITEHILAVVQHYRMLGKTIVLDLDDAYDCMPENVAAYPYWHKGMFNVNGHLHKLNYLPIDMLNAGAKLFDAITTPSRIIQQDWGKFVPADKVYYIPNYIDIARYDVNQRQPHDDIVVGWGGSHSHLSSFLDSKVVEGVEKAFKVDQRLRLLLAGGDARVLKLLHLDPNRIKMQPWVPPLEWPKVLARFDIGLIPLAGEYDKRRSWIKAMEYAAMKIPFVTNSAVAEQQYGVFMQYGKAIRSSAAQWRDAILELAANRDELQIEAAYQEAQRQDINNNIESVVAVYQQIIDSRS